MNKIILFFSLFSVWLGAQAQCDPEVPTYVIDLSANADTTWILYEADALDRNGQCCGVASSSNCIRFEITLNPNAAGIFFDYDGAGAFGSLNWREDCGAEHSLKDTICVTSQQFTLTFCKPGSDNGNYTLISVPRPIFPQDQFVPMNCVQPVEVLGVTASTIVWESISPGNDGEYDSYLSCSDCLEPVFTPNPNGPTEIEYRVCGYPILDYCVGSFVYCDTVKFTVQDSLKVHIDNINPAFCSGGSVELTAWAEGGDGNYSFFWYNSSLELVGSGPTYDADEAGSYICEVRDGNYQANYCAGFFDNVVVSETFPPELNAGADQVLCSQSPNATIVATYQYTSGILWSEGDGTYQGGTTNDTIVYIPTQQELSDGLVTLTLSTVGVGGGCFDTTDEIQLFFVDTVETNLTDQLLLCNNGTISLNPVVTGGVGEMTYSWTNGLNSLSNVLGEGTHCLTIVDGNNCQTTHCLTISAPPAMNLSTSSTPVTTDGGNDGTATALITGGTGNYTFNWSNGGSTQTITGLNYGLYTVTVTDENGCERVASVVVNEPRCDDYYINTSVTPVTCFGGADGTADVIITNGSSPFDFSWNDPSSQNISNATGLSSGVYTVIVTDALNCVAVATATIVEPSPLISSISHTDVSIQGGNDGSALANITGGTSGYLFDWSNGSTLSGATGLSAGVHYLTITDGNGCIVEDSVQISEPPCNEFYALIGTTSPLCFGESTATANLVLINGQFPYSITWSTGQQDVMNVSGLPGGFHTVEITDSRNCTIFQTFGVSQPSPLSTGIIPTPPTCNGSNNGTVDLSISGGTYPYYSISWSNGSTAEDQINLDPGSYSVSIEDLNGCTATNSVTVTEPEILSVSETHVDVSCYGLSDGSIDVTVSGGTVPYVYSWSNGAATEDLSGIDLGGYYLGITDANNCGLESQLSVQIEQPDTLISTLTSPEFLSGDNISCFGYSDGSIDLDVVGGTAPYVYSWSNNETSEDLEDLAAGDYSVTGTDQKGCTFSASITLSEPDGMLPSTVAATYPSGSNISCHGATDGSIDLSVTGGGEPYTYDWSSGQSTQDVDGLTAGTYTVIISEVNGCTVTTSVTLLEPEELQLTGVITDPGCYMFDNGSINVTVTGGAAPFIYSWSNGAEDEDIFGLSSGAYTVTITDTNNCLIENTFVLDQPDSLMVELSSPLNFHDHNISLYGEDDGIITSQVTGGTSPYTYDWSNGSTESDLDGLTAGVYYVTLTDAQGCVASDTITLTQPYELELPTIFTPNQDGDNDVFDIHGIEAYPDNTLTVVNRWGNVVYTEDGYHNTWTGTHQNGEELPDGVYFVILKINGGEIEKNSYVHIKKY